MTERLSEEREREIRRWSANADEDPPLTHEYRAIRDLLSEIDALRAEPDQDWNAPIVRRDDNL